MKTSNKLLLTVLAIVIICIFIVTIIAKNRTNIQNNSKVKVELDSINGPHQSDSDSIDMEKAIDNE